MTSRLVRRALEAAVVALFVAACGPAGDETGEPAGEGAGVAPSPEAAGAPGRLVIVGGALDSGNAPVWEAVLEARDGDGPVCVIPTASGAPRRSMESASETLDGYGGPGTAVGVMITVDDVSLATDAEIVQILRDCSGYWFTGGAQSRIVDTFLPGGSPTPALQAVRERVRDGAVLAGTSAGAAMMSDPMIAAGSSEGAFSAGLRAEEDGDGVWIRDGLGFFEGGVLDQHFLARGRIGRLLISVRDHPRIDAGFGIDENTAMIVDGGVAEVVGASGVVVVDGPGSGEDRLRVVMAGAGDRIDLASREVTPAAGKDPLVQTEAAVPEEGIFGEWTFLRLMVGLASSDAQAAAFDVRGGRLEIVEGEAFRGVALEEGEGVAGTPPGFSAGPFDVEIATSSR